MTFLLTATNCLFLLIILCYIYIWQGYGRVYAADFPLIVQEKKKLKIFEKHMSSSIVKKILEFCNVLLVPLLYYFFMKFHIWVIPPKYSIFVCNFSKYFNLSNNFIDFQQTKNGSFQQIFISEKNVKRNLGI